MGSVILLSAQDVAKEGGSSKLAPNWVDSSVESLKSFEVGFWKSISPWQFCFTSFNHVVNRHK